MVAVLVFIPSAAVAMDLGDADGRIIAVAGAAAGRRLIVETEL